MQCLRIIYNITKCSVHVKAKKKEICQSRVGEDGGCMSTTACKVQGKLYFCNICPCSNYIVCARFEDFGNFLVRFYTPLS